MVVVSTTDFMEHQEYRERIQKDLLKEARHRSSNGMHLSFLENFSRTTEQGAVSEVDMCSNGKSRRVDGIDRESKILKPT